MVAKKYIPEQGDIVYVDLRPTKGREQTKIRPALVVSPYKYNIKAGLALMCPITSVSKGYPFEVPVNDVRISGVVLADHVRSLDYKERNAKLISRAKPVLLKEVKKKLLLLVGDFE